MLRITSFNWWTVLPSSMPALMESRCRAGSR